MTVISGHQRLKACRDLDIDLVPAIIREDLTDEDKKLKKLLATNFGRLKNNPVKQVKVFAEYEKLCGITHGGSRPQNAVSQEDIAKELGVSVDTIQRLKKLEKLSPELQQLIEDGTVKYTTALNVWGKLPQEEQIRLKHLKPRLQINQRRIVMNKLVTTSFNYSQLDLNTADFLKTKENNMRNITEKAVTELGKELKEAQDELAKRGYGCFGEWYESLNFSEGTVRNLINRFNLIESANFAETELIEALPRTLSYEIARPNIDEALKQLVLDGKVKTLKEYK